MKISMPVIQIIMIVYIQISNHHMYHCMIYGINDESYTEALSHINIELKHTYYYCVIKYDLPFVDINDVYIEVFSRIFI